MIVVDQMDRIGKVYIEYCSQGIYLIKWQPVGAYISNCLRLYKRLPKLKMKNEKMASLL